jgi:hypothetical protein
MEHVQPIKKKYILKIIRICDPISVAFYYTIRPIEDLRMAF